MSSVEVWYVRTGEPSGPRALDAWSRVLSEEERERAARFVFARDRDAFVAAHALLRFALTRRASGPGWGPGPGSVSGSVSGSGSASGRRSASGLGPAPVPVPPERWRFRSGPHGRPEVAGPEARLGLRFSLSHTPGLAVCAVTSGAPLGVDGEATARRAPLEIAEHCCAAREREALAALPEAQRPDRFFEYWTLKEAFLKALGLGLSYPPDRIGFSVAPPHPVRVELLADLGESPDAWQFESWRLPGARLALAVRSDGVRRPVSLAEAIPAHPGPGATRSTRSIRSTRSAGPCVPAAPPRRIHPGPASPWPDRLARAALPPGGCVGKIPFPAGPHPAVRDVVRRDPSGRPSARAGGTLRDEPPDLSIEAEEGAPGRSASGSSRSIHSYDLPSTKEPEA